MRRLRVLYFFYYAGVGTFLGYFAPYLRGLGFSGSDVAAVTTPAQLAGVVAALAWAQVADRFSPAAALRVCGVCAVVCGAGRSAGRRADAVRVSRLRGGMGAGGAAGAVFCGHPQGSGGRRGACGAGASPP